MSVVTGRSAMARPLANDHLPTTCRRFPILRRYHWVDLTTYNGEMRAGRREGRGTFVWATGEMYFGECVEGVEHGRAVYTKVNRSFYDGVWVDGQRHGAGVSFPPADGAGGQEFYRNWKSVSTYEPKERSQIHL
eukprot:6390217-Pyramimonas_sp.AAC.1